MIFTLCRIHELGLIIPFAVISILTLRGTNFDLKTFLLLLSTLSCGFMTGCAFNGWSDRNFDAKNPRTKHRPIASGIITGKEGAVVIAFLGITTVILTFLISPLLLLLFPIPATLCCFYSLSKRYTWLCHALIGAVHAIVPVSVAIVFGEILTWKTVFITAITSLSTTETDLLYSIGDMEYDRLLHLKSVPVVFGAQKAMTISFLCYFLSLCVQILLYIILSFRLLSVITACCANLLLLSNHISVHFRYISGKRILRVYQISVLLLTAAVSMNSL